LTADKLYSSSKPIGVETSGCIYLTVRRADAVVIK